jgi:dipeptidyl aminopeptidase/acylaminoacyl peptidase
MTETIPYGAWPSPISAADVARSGVRLGFVAVAGDEVWWTEGRPSEGGRQVVVSRQGDVLPAPWNARTRVHEYGGTCWLPVPNGTGGHSLVFTEWGDQRLYLLHSGGEPQALTPEPPIAAGWRYADLTLSTDGTEVWCVRESHADPGGHDVSRAIVAVPLDGSGEVREVVSGSHFLAYPRLSPDGSRLAWIAWEHPNMPWDGTELRVGSVRNGRVSEWGTLLGGPSESVQQPLWLNNDELIVISDRSGWWNLYRLNASGGDPVPLAPRDEEFGEPLWMLGYSTFASLDDGRIVVKHGLGRDVLGVLDPQTGELRDLDLPFTAWRPTLVASGSKVTAIAASPIEPLSVVTVDVASGSHEVLRRSLNVTPDPEYLPQPWALVAHGPDRRDVHANVYPPHNPNATAPEGERPPYVVFVHGGPTSASPMVLDLQKAYFTSRGIGVVDVNYGGSTGYGREYRERLRGQWGVVDVEDCVAAVEELVRRGEADGGRLAIEGGSAGGWTTLAALTRTKAFACGTSYFGVAELVKFAEDTHDFESRYLDSLIGSLPDDMDLYVQRAPLTHVDELSCPVLLLQGLEDKVVPPSQTEMFAEALRRKGIPFAYLAFEGEQHGFRKAETIIASLEAELSFYGQVFGFTPPGVPVLPLENGNE